MKSEASENSSIIKHEEIYRAYKTAAKVVAVYGDVYLPIFQRLHEEMQRVEENKKIKLLVLSVADQ